MPEFTKFRLGSWWGRTGEGGTRVWGRWGRQEKWSRNWLRTWNRREIILGVKVNNGSRIEDRERKLVLGMGMRIWNGNEFWERE